MNLNMKQQTLQYHTIPDGGDDDVVVLEHQQEKSTGRTYSVLVGLVLLLVAAAVVLQGGGRPYDPAGSRLDGGVFGTPPTSAAEGTVLASITTLSVGSSVDSGAAVEKSTGSRPFLKPVDCGYCYAGCCGANWLCYTGCCATNCCYSSTGTDIDEQAKYCN